MGESFVPQFKTFVVEVEDYVNSVRKAIVSAGQKYAAAGGDSFGGSWSDVAKEFQLRASKEIYRFIETNASVSAQFAH